MIPTQFVRGDVVRVRLDPIEGHEQRGTSRPCVVVQNDIGNRHSETTIIVPLTDASNKTTFPFQALIQNGDGGTTKESLALCDQVRIIDKSRIYGKLGHLSDSAMALINQALCNSLSL